jgi:hypothetical protein
MSFNTIGLGQTPEEDTCGCLNFEAKLNDVYYSMWIIRPITSDANFKTKYEKILKPFKILKYLSVA